MENLQLDIGTKRVLISAVAKQNQGVLSVLENTGGYMLG